MVSVLAKDLTKRALTVSREVISFGKTARLVSPRYTRNTRPKGCKFLSRDVIPSENVSCFIFLGCKFLAAGDASEKI